jgi:PEP-CTERM motif
MKAIKFLFVLPAIALAITFSGAMPTHADITLALDPVTTTILPGTTNFIITGTLGNNDGIDDPFFGANFNLTNGPSGADLNTAASFDTLFAPDPLPSTGYVGQLFSIDVDPGATTGVYTGNFDLQYLNGDTGALEDANQDFTFDVENPNATVTPEPSSLWLFGIGLTAVGLLGLRARKAVVRIK